MSKVVQFPDVDNIEEQACDFLALLDSGDITASETAELKCWLEDDPRHAHALLEMAQLLDHMSVVSALNKLLPLDEVDMSLSAPPPQVRLRPPFWPGLKTLTLATTACALVLVVWAGFWAIESPSRNLATEHRTLIGEIKEIPLADASRVTLNTNSHLVSNFSNEERKIVLLEGEAMFEVAHDPGRPFIVDAGVYQIRAIGTAFNVEYLRRNVEVTVTEGSVEILSSQTGSRIQQLVEGEAAIIEQSDDEVQPAVRPVDAKIVDKVLGWRRGVLVFEGEPFGIRSSGAQSL